MTTIRRTGPAGTPIATTPSAPAATSDSRPANAAVPSGSSFQAGAPEATRAPDSVAQAHVPLPSMGLGQAPAHESISTLDLNSTEAQAAIKASVGYLSQPQFAASGVKGATAPTTFAPRQVMKDDLGMTHVRLDQMVDGLKVFGQQTITHLNPDGSVQDTTNPPAAETFAAGARGDARLSAGAAIQSAEKIFAHDNGGLQPQNPSTAELLYYKADDGKLHKAYRVEVSNFTGGDKPLRMNYFIDAQSGKSLAKFNTIDGVELPRSTAATPITVTGSDTPNAPIKDYQTTTSTIHVDKDLDLSKVTADLDISHSYRGDLVVTVTSPSGKTVTLSNREGGPADDIKQSFDLSQAFAGEKTVGDWKLSVSDKAGGDQGTLNGWKLNLTGADKSQPPPDGAVELKGAATPKAPILDNQTTTSTIHLDGDATIDDLKLSVDVSHTYRGDLTAFLTAPDGTQVQLLNREGGSAHDWKLSDQDLAQFRGKSAKGDWTLTVKDNAARDTGTLNSWSLDVLGHNGQPPPPPPPPPGQQGTGHSMYSGDVPISAKQNPDGTWSLIDDSRGGGKTLDAQNKTTATGDNEFKDSNDIWGEAADNAREKAAVDAHFGMEMTWDFYKNVLGRNSIDGRGEALNSYVHLGNNYNNAYWDGKQMQYGDGDGKEFSPLVAVDIAGHEITHGMTERTAGLVYQGQSGGLNEAMSDILGKGVQWYASQQDPSVKFSWGIGNVAFMPGKNDGTQALRYMNDPTQDNYSIDNLKDIGKYSPGQDQGGVHGSSGIANNAFYLMVQGGTNRTSGLSVQQGIGMEKALKILYRAETVYFTPNTDFKGAAQAAIKAATDLYGANSQEVATVTAAWKAVGCA